jgi:hypothetical protein
MPDKDSNTLQLETFCPRSAESQRPDGARGEREEQDARMQQAPILQPCSLSPIFWALFNFIIVSQVLMSKALAVLRTTAGSRLLAHGRRSAAAFRDD